MIRRVRYDPATFAVFRAACGPDIPTRRALWLWARAQPATVQDWRNTHGPE